MIELPNGANVEEIVLPNGRNATEVIGPDGSVVWSDGALPDKGLLHDLDPRAINVDDGDPVTSFPDTQGTADFDGSGTYRSSSIGDEPAIELNGSENFEDAALDLVQPLAIFYVHQHTDDNNSGMLMDGNNRFSMRHETDNNRLVMDAGDGNTGGSADTGENIASLILDNGSTEWRRNGSTEFTGTTGTNSTGATAIGSEFGDTSANGYVGPISRVLVYDLSEMDEGQISVVESELNDIYGVY